MPKPAPKLAPNLATPRELPFWQQWNTLQKLWAGLYIIWAFDAVLLITAIVAAQQHRGAMQTVGKDTAPSIIAAQDIKAALADMDANAANELLTKPDTPERKAALESYDKQRDVAAESLVKAARNITYEAEWAPIQTIQKGLGTYEGLVQRARDLYEWGDADYVKAYAAAAGHLDKELLPAADKLDEANNLELNKVYSAQSNDSTATSMGVVAAAVVLLIVLVRIQKFLYDRMHRVVNLPLLASTLLTIAFLFYTLGAMHTERENLRIAREDAFTSIHALKKARAVAYAANADESRYLLDTANARKHEAAFFQKVDLLAKLPPGASYSDIITAVRRDRKGADLKGYLADELNNITFGDEEWVPAFSTLQWFAEYYNIDRRIRNLQQSGKHAEALAVCIGMSQGDSNYAFDQFDKNLGKTLEVNQVEFDKAVTRGFEALSYLELKAVIFVLTIAALAFIGLLQRIREYA